VFTRAVVRPPAANFASGLTTAELGTPDFDLSLRQHEAYCRALEECGLKLTRLAADNRYPDSTFVEDTAVLTSRGAVICRPGAASRLGETDEIQEVLRPQFTRIYTISDPGTVDGGDVCEAGDHFFIGVSRRTNEAGATQLAGFLAELGYSSTLIDIRGLSNILHLKSGIAYLGASRIVIIDEFRDRKEFSGYDLVHVNAEEAYAANCLVVNDRVLIAAGFTAFQRQLRDLDYDTIGLEMSEFQKMDGGLSCLSLRF
jgi:dimethylargininase